MADNSRKAELLLLIKEAGAKETAAEIQKLGAATSTVQRELNKIGRSEQIQQIGTEMGLLARKTKDTSAAVAELSKKLAGLGASKDEISAATSAFATAQTGGTTNRLARAGSELRALPSTQIPGLGIGTDAIGNFLRLGGALAGVSEKAAETSKVALALTPVVGQTAAGLASMAVAAAPFVLAAAAIALALKSLSDQAAEEADTINAIVDAQRQIGQDVARGLTSEEAKAQLQELEKLRQDETDRLSSLNQNYSENIESTGAFSGVLKALSGAEEALSSQIATSTTNVETYDTKIAALTLATQDGSLAANDAAEAEKALAEERSKTALSAADNAAKELQSQQRALNATEEQNQKRLSTIEDEKDVVQKQIDVLTESGVTSDEVTTKIAALKDQLGLLGKESDFISSTALEASRQADAEKQAKKDAEDATKKAQQAQEQYTKAVQSAAVTYTQSVEDSSIRLRYAYIDNAERTNRDLLALDTKYQQDEFDLRLKAGRKERDAALDQIDDLDKIREDAKKDAQEALREGDFKALFLARQSGEEALKADQDQFNKETQRRRTAQDDAFDDLKRADQRQRDAKLLSYRYANIDAQDAQTRELRQAQLTQNRALAQASASLNAELGIRQQFWNAVVGQAKQALGQVNGMQKPAGANATSPFGSFQGTFTAIQQVVRK